MINMISPKKIHRCAVEKGWWESGRSIPELLCLIHSEVSEALEAYRNSIPEGDKGCMSEELADVVIRVFDMSERLGIDIVAAVNKKYDYNLTRPYRHGGKVA